jgi:phage/plasmid-associated DNA primase
MLNNFTKLQLTQLANDMASGFGIVKYNHVLYLPVHYQTRAIEQTLAPEDRVWIPLYMQQVLDLASNTSKVMFYSEGEKSSFYGMVEQAAQPAYPTPGTVLLIKDDKLVELRPDGKLHDPTQEFCPHFIGTPVNDDPDAKAAVLATFVEWLDDSEENAVSLLSHIATSLAPHWSAVKYVLLIGEGRNGKSVLMKMIMSLLGEHNVSHVTRQDMSASKSTCLDLQGRIANIVFDGPASYLKDSGPEKSLIAGEKTPIRRLYSSLVTPVQTNALFIEGLNREPKTGDKSLALQKRLVRFQFTRVYELDYQFENHMLSQATLGAFLALLLDHYVQQQEVHQKLKPTQASTNLQLEQMHANSMPFQFIAWVDETDVLGVEGLSGEMLSDVAAKFKHWRLVEMGDINVWNDKDVEQMLLPLFTTERKSKRVNGKVRKVRAITGFQLQLSQFIEYLRGEEEADVTASGSTGTVVDEAELLHGATPGTAD